eukprot:3298385-Prymnesium_polylepis.1
MTAASPRKAKAVEKGAFARGAHMSRTCPMHARADAPSLQAAPVRSSGFVRPWNTHTHMARGSLSAAGGCGVRGSA